MKKNDKKIYKYYVIKTKHFFLILAKNCVGRGLKTLSNSGKKIFSKKLFICTQTRNYLKYIKITFINIIKIGII